MAKQIGSQYRESMEEANCALLGCMRDEIVLLDMSTDKLDLYVKNDFFAGAVVEVFGLGYEFVRNASKVDVTRVCAPEVVLLFTAMERATSNLHLFSPDAEGERR